ncbi:MAG: slr1659 superfamily regulator [Cyanobacteriota bacterium]|jgi:hypothetical protein
MTEIQAEDYRIYYDPDSKTCFLTGILRLEGMQEYQKIMDFLLVHLDRLPEFTLNLEGLEFLNSSGISMLSMFVVKVRERQTVQLVFKGSGKILWQTKSLRNLQRLLPSVRLEFS